MIFNRPAADPELSRQMARILNIINQPDAAVTMRNELELLKPGIAYFEFVAQNSDRPARVYVAWVDLTLVLYGGVNALQHATRYTDALNVNMDFSDLGGVNPWLNVTAYDDFLHIKNTRPLNNARVVIAGHSIGGATGIVLAAHLHVDTSLRSVSVITFGSPRPGPDFFTRGLATIDLARWMTTHDPVPQVPPRQNQAPLWFALLNNRERLNANRYVQPHGGLVIDSDGSVQDLDVPPVAEFATLQGNLGAWILLSWGGEETVHGLPTYQRRLFLRSQEPVPPVFQGGTTHSGLPNVLEPIQMRRDARIVIGQIREASGSGTSGQVVIPELEPYTAGKLGGLWCLFLRGQLIGVAPTRKRARHIASLGNQFLRILQVFGRVDADAYVAAYQLYLSDASDPLGGFKPVMRT